MYGKSLEGIEQLIMLMPNFYPRRSGIVINNYFISNSIIMMISETIEILLFFNLLRFNIEINRFKKEAGIHE